MANKEETTVLNHINDDCEYDIEETAIYYDTKDLANIDQLLCEPGSENIDQQIYSQIISTDQYDPALHPPNGPSNFNDEANGTQTSSISPYQCVKTRLSEDVHLPDRIFKSFRSQNKQGVINILIRVQDKRAEIWSDLDKRYKNIMITSRIWSQMYGEFRRAFASYLSKKYSTQARSVKDALSILEQSSFGILFLDTKNRILAVQNLCGTWSALKGHLVIKNDGTFETPRETLLRELFEEVSVKFKRNRSEKTINKDNIGHFLDLNEDNFLECYLDSRSGTNGSLRYIGLLVVSVDGTKWKFSLKDNKENKACQWLNIDDIIRNKPETGYDIYYTLRPFARYLKDNPMS